MIKAYHIVIFTCYHTLVKPKQKYSHKRKVSLTLLLVLLYSSGLFYYYFAHKLTFDLLMFTLLPNIIGLYVGMRRDSNDQHVAEFTNHKLNGLEAMEATVLAYIEDTRGEL